jgi:hypothetical protein
MYLVGIHLSDNILHKFNIYVADTPIPDLHYLATLIYITYIYILNEWGKFVPNLLHRLAVVSSGLASLPREAGLSIPPDGRTMNQ